MSTISLKAPKVRQAAPGSRVGEEERVHLDHVQAWITKSCKRRLINPSRVTEGQLCPERFKNSDSKRQTHLLWTKGKMRLIFRQGDGGGWGVCLMPQLHAPLICSIPALNWYPLCFLHFPVQKAPAISEAWRSQSPELSVIQIRGITQMFTCFE